MIFGGSGSHDLLLFLLPLRYSDFPEVLSGTNTELSDSGRPIYQVMEDRLSDDVYLYDIGSGSNNRISRSKFGFPVNYLSDLNATTPLPSNRFPSLVVMADLFILVPMQMAWVAWCLMFPIRYQQMTMGLGISTM